METEREPMLANPRPRVTRPGHLWWDCRVPEVDMVETDAEGMIVYASGRGGCWFAEDQS